MRIHLLAISLLGCTLCAFAQDNVPPAAEDKTASTSASTSVQASDRKIVIETEVNGQQEKQVLDLNDPSTVASLRGKVIITTDINGKKETRIVDLKDADKLLPPFMFNEKPPVRTGPVTYLGVATMEVPKEVSAQLPLSPDTGLLIGAVAPDSPAAKAGLQDSDVLSKFDDQILITQRQLAVLIANRKEGDAVKLTYFRKGRQMEATATLEKHIATASMEQADPLARVTRRILKVGDDGKPEFDFGAEAAGGLGLRFEKPVLGPVKVVGGEVKSREAIQGELHSKPNDLPAEQNVGRDIRRALEQLPAEVRPQVEKLLLESGVVPKGALPFRQPVVPAPPAEPKETQDPAPKAE